MSRQRRKHRWIALIALFGLLFQQVAMAMYVCPIESAGSVQSAPVAAQQAPCHAQDRSDPARCAQHCHPVAASADHAAPLLVPTALFSESWSGLLAHLDALRETPLPSTPVDPHANAPPLRVQHCTFQI